MAKVSKDNCSLCKVKRRMPARNNLLPLSLEGTGVLVHGRERSALQPMKQDECNLERECVNV